MQAEHKSSPGMLFLQNKQVDLRNSTVNATPHDGSVTLMSLHLSHRRAVSRPNLNQPLKTLGETVLELELTVH